MIGYIVKEHNFYNNNKYSYRSIICPHCKEIVEIYTTPCHSHSGNAICPICKKDYFFITSTVNIAYKQEPKE